MSDPLADVSRETLGKLAAFRALLITESRHQNLVSASTLDSAWERHILDSAQLFQLAPNGAGWLDIGSGAGLPGIVIASMTDAPVHLIEPRRLRAEFLRKVAGKLGLGNVTVDCAKAERVSGKYDVITARAVASLTRLVRLGAHLSHPGTIWVLPKGKNAKSELAEAQLSWQCEVREVPSLTDPEATILVLRNVEAKR